MAVFAKYDGIDGECKDANHDAWCDVLAVDWGAAKPGGGATGQSRRRGAAEVQDVTLTMEYEKAAPLIQKKCLSGEVIPTLEIHHTATYGGARATYLVYKLENVMITSYQVSASGNDDAGPPTVAVSNNFEKITVTYTEFDEAGSSKGDVEYDFDTSKGS
jgi:type VI secretion system secreted protein Hcp